MKKSKKNKPLGFLYRDKIFEVTDEGRTKAKYKVDKKFKKQLASSESQSNLHQIEQLAHSPPPFRQDYSSQLCDKAELQVSQQSHSLQLFSHDNRQHNNRQSNSSPIEMYDDQQQSLQNSNLQTSFGYNNSQQVLLLPYFGNLSSSQFEFDFEYDALDFGSSENDNIFNNEWIDFDGKIQDLEDSI